MWRRSYDTLPGRDRALYCRKMVPGSRCMSGNTCGCRMSWTYRWAVMVPRINTRGDRVLYAMPPHTIKLAVGAVCRCEFPRAWHHSKLRCRWVRVKGSTRNGRRDTKCPSARSLRMVREDTETPSEGATCALMVTEEAVGCTHAFLTMIDDWSVEGVLSLVFV
ncbi:uncharacterized protein TNCV_559331 [Trichonephila clavipes]|nr:uncharacterized protein TNCV_559331 [Trichonephila clavipes]